MKPSPIPLFNFRKRERHALVSDPLKNSNASAENVDVSSAPSNQVAASSFTNTNMSSEQSNLKYSKVVTNNSKPSSSYSFNNRSTTSPASSSSSSSWNVANNKPPAFPSNIKPPVTMPKPPALMSHKSGVNNRRMVSDNGSYVGGGRGINPNVPTKQIKPGSTNARGLQHARGKGGGTRGAGVSGSSPCGRGGKDGYSFVGGGWNDDNHFTSSNSFSSSGNDISSGYMSGCSSRSSSSTESWTKAQPASNTWSLQSGQTRNKTNSLKLQSGNLPTRFGMANKNQSQTNTSHTASTFTHRRDDPPSELASSKNIPYSIFDEEDVVQFPKDQKPPFEPVDTSLRLFTCPIRDAQSWSESGFYEGPVLFEVYGLIISSPTVINSGLGKEFYIRDQSATIRCIFYEIDRELPNVMRGQVHRVVGSFDRKQVGVCGGGSYLKAVSVRKADKVERQTCQDATELSLKEMDRLARQMDKEP